MRNTLLNGFLAAAVAVAFLLIGVPRMVGGADDTPQAPRASAEDVQARNLVADAILEHVERALRDGWLVSILVSHGEPTVTATPRSGFADPERWLRSHRGEVNREVFRAAPARVDWRPVLQACAAAIESGSLPESSSPPALVDVRVDVDGILHLVPHLDEYVDAWEWMQAFEELDRAFSTHFPGLAPAGPRIRRRGPNPLGTEVLENSALPHTAARFQDPTRLVIFSSGVDPRSGNALDGSERGSVLRALSASVLDS